MILTYWQSQSTVHPHARGEHAAAFCAFDVNCGSSPRPWGTPHGEFLRKFVITVHPHARGEHSPRNSDTVASIGSSPRPWGTQQNEICAHDMLRFIPTPVGNTYIMNRPSEIQAVHPHARGEHTNSA